MTTASTTAPPPAALDKKTARKRRRTSGPAPRTIAAFLLPFFVPFVLFYLVPIIYAIVQSMTVIKREPGMYGRSYTAFGGFEQYAKAIANPELWGSIGRVALFGIVQVPVMLGVALLIALLLDSAAARWKGFFRVAAFMPYAIPGVIAAIMWSFLYSPQLSPLVDMAEKIGWHLDFLGPGAVLWSIANISTWLWTGYNMLIMFSSLQSIPAEIYEAARLDGASQWDIAVRIKIPMIFPSIIMTTIFSIIGTLQLYGEPAVLQQISTNISSTYTPNMLAYSFAVGNNYPQGAAVSVFIAVLTFVLSYGFMRLTNKRSGL